MAHYSYFKLHRQADVKLINGGRVQQAIDSQAASGKVDVPGAVRLWQAKGRLCAHNGESVYCPLITQITFVHLAQTYSAIFWTGKIFSVARMTNSSQQSGGLMVIWR